MISTIALIIPLILFCKADTQMDVEKAFKDNGIVSDVLDVAPKKCLSVKYANNLEASLGNELTPTQVKDIPTLKWDAEKDAYYTVLMVDPDAPSRAKPMFEVRHWLVMNVPGDEVEKGETISEFIGSGPPEGTGLHRYIFLIYKQPNGKITHDEPHTTNRSREHRFDSNARKFVEKHNLGVPQFGNFYQAQYDDYVPKLHAQLSGQ